jgi:hypothetical protein
MTAVQSKDDDKSKDKDKDKKKHIKLRIVVNGTPVEIKLDLAEPLVSALIPALAEAKIAGEPETERWVFKDEEGNVLDKNQQISTFGFDKDSVIFLSLEAGIAG